MSNIDISKIKPGDTVRYHFQDRYMEELGIKPKEGTSQVYKKRDLLCSLYVDGHILQNWGLTILEHVPARPEWADAQVIRVNEADGEAFGVRTLRGEYRFSGGLVFSVNQLVLDDAEITVVLDKDGKPPAPQPNAGDVAVAWAHYRKSYTPNPDHLGAAHKAFYAAWDVATATDSEMLDKDGNPPKPEEPEIEWLNEEDLNKLPPCSVVKPRVLSRPRTKGFDGKWYAGESLVDTSPYITPARVIYIPEEN